MCVCVCQDWVFTIKLWVFKYYFLSFITLLLSVYLFLTAAVSDDLSISSSSSSHGVSRSPSPPYSSSPFTAAGTATPAAMPESYSRKVFVGGLPPDIDQGIVSFILTPNCMVCLFVKQPFF